jgi:hypothetical protein
MVEKIACDRPKRGFERKAAGHQAQTAKNSPQMT